MNYIAQRFRAQIALFALSLFCGAVQAQSTITNGSCPRVDQVYANWEITATTPNAGGGWSVPKYAFSGGHAGVATATKFNGCFTGKTASTNPNRNNVVCLFLLKNSVPTPSMHVTKVKPANYDCSCNNTTGAYSCTVK